DARAAGGQGPLLGPARRLREGVTGPGGGGPGPRIRGEQRRQHLLERRRRRVGAAGQRRGEVHGQLPRGGTLAPRQGREGLQGAGRGRPHVLGGVGGVPLEHLGGHVPRGAVDQAGGGQAHIRLVQGDPE